MFSHPLTTTRAKIPDNILTHTDRRLPGPAVVLLADAHGHPDQAEAGLALIDHTAAVVVVNLLTTKALETYLISLFTGKINEKVVQGDS